MSGADTRFGQVAFVKPPIANRSTRRTSGPLPCCNGMFGLFKKDPVAKLQKEHSDLLAKAFEMSKIDRRKADELTAKAAEIERQIEKLSKG